MALNEKTHKDIAILEVYTDTSLVMNEIYFNLLADAQKDSVPMDKIVESHSKDTIELFWGFNADLKEGGLDYYKRIKFDVETINKDKAPVSLQSQVLSIRRERGN